MYNVETELKILENSLRDFIQYTLLRKYGVGWLDCLKVSPERLSHWRERMKTESERLTGEALESRLLYYSDFYDLWSIISKHWDDGFREAFHNKRKVEVMLEEMGKLRDPNAHRRELHEYQKHLILGVSGVLRTSIMKSRGKRDSVDDYFPVIEAVTDSLGNKMSNPGYGTPIEVAAPVRVGDETEIRVFSTDPLGDELEYSITRIGQTEWNSSNTQVIKFTNADVGKACDINRPLAKVINRAQH